ncbi:cytochrome P450 4C1-like isoform X2 [Belonocnema kinseyi]|nr:cytochrome P450 4C1-like isoform X2 [Belonocnema kinseyi]
MSGIGICHPEYTQILLTNTKNIEKSMIYNLFHPWLGTGLLTSTGEKWQRRRKMLTPAFHFNILKGFVDIFVEEAEKLIQSLKKEGDVLIKDIEPLLTKFTLNSICETAMGTSLESMNEEGQYRSAVREMGDFIFFRLLRPWFHFDWLFSITPSGFKQRKIIKILHDFSTQIIDDRKKYHEEAFPIQKSEAEDEVFEKKRMAMLDVIISASKNTGIIDDEGIREEVDTFVFEGHDTTAMGLIFAVALLAEHKEIQELARNEICAVLKESEGKMGMAEINRFVYLERCIKESLRLYPSVPVITRVIREDLKMKDYLIPAGSNVHLYIYDLHRDPNFWPNPEKFDPDRFLTEEIQKRHPFSYVPFSGGQRNCIGQKFAMLELKTLIAHLLYHFNLEAIDRAHEVVIIQDLVLRPKHPVRVKFKSIPRF